LSRREITVVGVCAVDRCADGAEPVIGSLRPVVRQSPEGLLVRLAGCPFRGRCDHDGTYVQVQRCTETGRPVGAGSALVAHDAESCATRVGAWLRGHRILRRR
jgi:hypothetical protein